VGNKYISKVHNPIIVSTKRKERKNSNKHLAACWLLDRLLVIPKCLFRVK